MRIGNLEFIYMESNMEIQYVGTECNEGLY